MPYEYLQPLQGELSVLQFWQLMNIHFQMDGHSDCVTRNGIDTNMNEHQTKNDSDGANEGSQNALELNRMLNDDFKVGGDDNGWFPNIEHGFDDNANSVSSNGIHNKSSSYNGIPGSGATLENVDIHNTDFTCYDLPELQAKDLNEQVSFLLLGWVLLLFRDNEPGSKITFAWSMSATGNPLRQHTIPADVETVSQVLDAVQDVNMEEIGDRRRIFLSTVPSSSEDPTVSSPF